MHAHVHAHVHVHVHVHAHVRVNVHAHVHAHVHARVRLRLRVRLRAVLAHRAAYDGVRQLDAFIGSSEAGGGERARARDGQRGAEIEHSVHLRPCVSEAATLRVGSRNPALPRLQPHKAAPYTPQVEQGELEAGSAHLAARRRSLRPERRASDQ